MSIKSTDHFCGLWFYNAFSDKLKIVRNRFARVIFGVTSSPFLLNEAIRKYAKNYELDNDFVNNILDCFYVDDFTGTVKAISTKLLTFLKNLKLRFLDRHFHLLK